MFKPVSSKSSFPQMEEGILRFWAAHGTFQKSIANRQGAKEYVVKPVDPEELLAKIASLA